MMKEEKGIKERRNDSILDTQELNHSVTQSLPI